jgi:hypothetical protein
MSKSVGTSEPEKGCSVWADEKRRCYEAQEEGRWVREEKKNKYKTKRNRR